MLSFIHIYWPPLFKLDRADAGWSPTRASPASNSRGIGGIHTWRGLSKNRRILSLQQMKRFILDCIYAWMCTICSSVKYYNLCCSMTMFMTMFCMQEVKGRLCRIRGFPFLSLRWRCSAMYVVPSNWMQLWATDTWKKKKTLHGKKIEL